MPWQPQGRDRKKSLALVVILHVALGMALLHGLAGEPLRRTAEALATFDVRPPPPTPPVQPPREMAAAAIRDAGATALAARPAPIVAPVPEVRLPVPPRLATTQQAAPDSASAAQAGAGLAPGEGIGAASGGSGAGGGGSGGGGAGGEGSGSGPASEAWLVSGNLSRGDYRRIRSFGAPRGQAVLAIEVGQDGRLTRCWPFASSGNQALDIELCRLLARTRWEPARDRAGDRVAVALRYVATWDRE